MPAAAGIFSFQTLESVLPPPPVAAVVAADFVFVKAFFLTVFFEIRAHKSGLSCQNALAVAVKKELLSVFVFEDILHLFLSPLPFLGTGTHAPFLNSAGSVTIPSFSTALDGPSNLSVSLSPSFLPLCASQICPSPYMPQASDTERTSPSALGYIFPFILPSFPVSLRPTPERAPIIPSPVPRR